MKHTFKNQCSNVDRLLTDCTTLNEFITRCNKYDANLRGYAFEAMVEVLLANNFMPNINDYQVWCEIEQGLDTGIDGIGISDNGNPHTIQIKLKSTDAGDDVKVLSPYKDKISNFVAKSLCMFHGYNIDMTVITTASSEKHHHFQSMFHDKVNIIGYNELCDIVDDNHDFWHIFHVEMLEDILHMQHIPEPNLQF